jgi:hypothetical protein
MATPTLTPDQIAQASELVLERIAMQPKVVIGRLLF